ncbi:MAG: 5'/3'-nucleotidase SurE [Gammaproteobacteria bacterium]|nr:5'/3'-nucleotidase SurE [Gammaproteobacteria bacterium]
MKNNEPLHILLTNDDGHQAPGIQALHRVLKRAGHYVSMVAPSTEQSATSMGVTSRRNLALEQLEDRIWHLDGQPVDTVLVALRHLLEDNPPDLVLSGINFGPNVGTALYMSGTIGAAIMASLNGVPAIAVSAGMRFDEVGTPFQSTLDVLEPAAEFVCSVLNSLQGSVGKNGRLLPKEVFLNINYPPLPKDQIMGVLHPEISGGHIIDLGYHRCDETGHVVPRFYPGVNPSEPHKEDGDVRAHMEGYITISAVKPRWNPPAKQAKKLRKRLEGLA